MAGRCELCDGKIVNGRCVECGMDYTRRKNRYHLNENCDEYDLNARKINDAYEDTLRGKGEPQEGKKKKEKTRLNARASAKPNVQRKESWNGQTVFPEENATRQKPSRSSAGKKPAAKGKKLAIAVAVFSVLFSLLGQLWEEFSDSRYTPATVYSEAEVYEPPVYDDSLPEMPKTDYEVGFELNAYGCYIAGVDIPAGIYAFANEDEDFSASIHIMQPEYDLYGDYYLDVGESAEGIRLYDGAMLRIDEYTKIYCDCQEAQTDAMHGWDADVGNYVVISAEEEEETEYIVGEDIAPGRYTVRYEGDGTSVLGIRAESGNYYEYFSLSCETYSPESAQYLGLVLQEGDCVYMQRYGSDESMAEFVPMTGSIEYLEGSF